MWVAFALQHICVSLDVNFNESLTNDIVSFEQLGPDLLRSLWAWHILNRPCQEKEGVFKYVQNMQVHYYPVHPHSFVLVFALHWYILAWMILYVDSENWSDSENEVADQGLYSLVTHAQRYIITWCSQNYGQFVFFMVGSRGASALRRGRWGRGYG